MEIIVLALTLMMLADTGPIWIGVDALESDVPPALVERLQLGAAEFLGLRQAQQAKTGVWQNRLAAINSSFRQGNLEASRAAVTRLIEELSADTHPWLVSVDLLAESLLMLGQIQLLLDDELGAAAAFQSHHALRPQSSPDPSLYRPEVLKAYDRLAVATLAGTRRSLQVEVRPAGATVWLDGRPRGQAPMTIKALLPGRHYLRIVAGARSVQRVVDLGSEGRVIRADLGADAQTAGAFFSAWRERLGAERLQRAASASGHGRVRFAVGVTRERGHYDLFGVRIDAAGQIEGLSVVRLTSDQASLDPVNDLLRGLRDASAPPPSEQLARRAFGRSPNQMKPVILGAVVSGVVVTALSVVGLAWWLDESSGIVIEPGGLR